MLKKSAINLAIAASLGLGLNATAHAAAVLTWDLGDYNNDGLMSDFAFFSAPTGNSGNMFGRTGETGCINAADGNTCDPVAMNGTAIGTDVFTTGFNFGGTGDFKPNVTAGGALADVTNSVLTFGALNFGGTFPGPGGTQFFLAPDDLNAVNVEDITSLGQDANGNDLFGVVVRYIGTIDDPTSPFHNFQSNWRLEGIMTVEGAGPIDTCADVTPVTTVDTIGGGQSGAVNGTVVESFTGQITTTAGLSSGGKNSVKICAGTTVDYVVSSTDGSTVTCSTGATSGTLAPGDKLICTNKPTGSDTDRFSVKGVAP